MRGSMRGQLCFYLVSTRLARLPSSDTSLGATSRSSTLDPSQPRIASSPSCTESERR